MPSRQDIQNFDKILTTLGNEPAIAARRGEEIEEVPEPEEGLSEDISALLGEDFDAGAGTPESEEEPRSMEELFAAPEETAEGAEQAEEGEEEAEEADEGFLRDFAASMQEEGEGAEEESGAKAPAGEGEAGPSEEDLFGDISLPEEDFFGELPAEGEAEGGPEGEPVPSEEAATPAGEPTPAAGEPAPPAEEAAPPEEELQAPADEEVSGEPEGGEPAAREVEEPEEIFGFPEEEWPGMTGEEDEEAPEEPEPAEAEEPADVGEPEEFGDLGDFGDLFDEEFAEPEESAAAGSQPEEPEEAEQAEQAEGGPLPGTEGEEPEELEAAETEEPVDVGEPEEFGDLGDFGDLFGEEFGEPEEAAAAGRQPEEPEAPEQAEEAEGAPDVFGEAEPFEENPFEGVEIGGEFEEAPGADERAGAGAEEFAQEGAGEGADELESFDFDTDFGEFEEDAGESGGFDIPEGFEEVLEEEPEGAQGGESASGSSVPQSEDEFSFDVEEGADSLPAESDEFSFDESEFEEAEPGAEDLEDVGEVDEFSLGDFGAEFGVLEEEEEAEREAELNPALDVSGNPPEAVDRAAADVELTEEEFTSLQRSLGNLPLNIKLAVEQIIGENKGGADQIERLIRMLVADESPRAIADYAGKILGKELRVPKGYEKRTGVAFEQERGSFAYRFRENIVPILRLVGAALLVIGLISFLGYRYIYRPLYARSLYEQGLGDVRAERYTQANDKFGRAVDVWRVKKRYYQFAEAFTGKRQYSLAVQKYEQLLSHYPLDKKGILDYAHLESAILADYQKAESLLESYLDRNMFDYEALMASGDNYMAWAEEEPSHYEDARKAYATLIEQYGDRDELLMKMLSYFIATDNEKQVTYLKNVFQDDPRANIDPLVYAQLGGYLIDKNELGDVSEILMRALRKNDKLPEIHYQLARYYQRADDPTSERRALRNTRTLLEALEPLSKSRTAILIDTYRRMAENAYGREEYLTAQQNYTRGIRRFEEARQANVLKPKREFGALYAGLGDIFYYQSKDFDGALEQYNKAEANGYKTKALNYKQGYVYYRNGQYDQAIDRFFDAAGTYTSNRNILYAEANTLYQKGNYFAAQGYYLDLLDRLHNERSKIGTLLLNEDPEHRALVDYLIKVNNNLGVTSYRLYQRSSDPQKLTDAEVYLKNSTEDSVNLNRSDTTGARAQSVDLAYLNLRYVLYPETDYRLQLYGDLPLDLEDLQF